MPGEGRCYFWLSMDDADMLIVLSLARNMGIHKEQLIMNALRTELTRLQEEFRQQRKIQPQPTGTGDSSPDKPEDKGAESKPKGEKESDEK